MIVILYSLIVFLATTLGAITGAGGGAIIKPVFDLVGVDTASMISVYSTIAVFTMCISSIVKHLCNGISYRWDWLLTLSLGSIVGGLIGEHIFQKVTENISNEQVTLIQSILLLCVLLSVLIFTSSGDRIQTLKLSNRGILFFLGLLAGAISVFVGIGGGPLNIIVLMGMMSLTTKESTAYSIAMIFFAQIPKVIKIMATVNHLSFNPWMIPLIALSAILGGMIGTKLNHQFTEKQVRRMYSMMMIGLISVCVLNIVSNI